MTYIPGRNMCTIKISCFINWVRNILIINIKFFSVLMCAFYAFTSKTDKYL